MSNVKNSSGEALPPERRRVSVRRLGAAALWLAVLGFLLPAAGALVVVSKLAPPLLAPLPAPSNTAGPSPGQNAAGALPILFALSVLAELTALVLGSLARRSLPGKVAAGGAALALFGLAIILLIVAAPAP